MNQGAKFWRASLPVLVMAIGIGLFGHPVSRGIQLTDGTIHFVQVPRLVSAATTVNRARAWGATYYFTIDIPAGAGEPLQKLELQQQAGVERLQFRLEESGAFEGDRMNPGVPLKLTAATVNEETWSFTFEPPVTPGRKVTLLLRPVHNPDVGGVYLIKVTAFPAGEKVGSYSMGYGRLHFYDSSPFGRW